MMRIFWSVLLCCFVLSASASERIASYTLFKTVTKEEFREMSNKRHLPKSAVPAKYDVDIYDITYYTKWHDGSTIKATGLYYVPKNTPKPRAEMIYDHGTRVNRGRRGELGGEENICLAFAMDGYAVIQPDYIGLGMGDKFHLYQVAESEGQASVDMLLAARELNDTLQVKTNGQLFITGYSQGGHASLATHKLIQEKYAGSITVTASSPMSGAYDMAGVQSLVMSKPYSRPHYLPYLLQSFNEVYHFVPGSINAIYRHPYDSLIPLLFDGKHSINKIDKSLPAVPLEMIKEDFVTAYISDSLHPLRVALRQNSLCNWKPEAPVQLCYCDSDEQVTPLNALVAYKSMKALGAEHVTLRRAGKKFGHGRCAPIAAMYTKMYFDTFRHGSKYGGKGRAGQLMVASIAKSILTKNPKKKKKGEKKKEGKA